MRIKLLFIFNFLLFAVAIFAQNANGVLIDGTNTQTRDASAAFQVWARTDASDATKKGGFLMPTVALTAVNDATTISGTEATGLIVFNDGTGGLSPAGFYYWTGTAWMQLATASGGTGYIQNQNSAVQNPGTFWIQGVARVGDGTAAAPGLSFNTSSNTGLYLPAANQLGISTGGTERIRIDANGGVGIATTSILGESTLILGQETPGGGEGGQLQINPNTTDGYTTAHFLDVYGNTLRIMRGTTAGSATQEMTIDNAGIVQLNAYTTNGLLKTTSGTGTLAVATSGTDYDPSITNEGSLTVGAGGVSSSTIVSNTSGSTAVTIAAGMGLTVTEAGSTITPALDYAASLTTEPIVGVLGANQTVHSTTGIIYEGSVADGFEGLLTSTNPTADRTWTLPNASGTIAVSATAPLALSAAGDVSFSGWPANASGVLSNNGSGTLTWVDNMPSGDGDYIQNQTGSAQSGAGFNTAGNGLVSGYFQPSAGNTAANGIKFPADPYGGSGDIAWLRYTQRSGEALTLELGIANDVDDHIALMPSGNVGIGNNVPAYKLDVSGAGNYTGTLRIGTYTLPNTDGTNGQVLKTNGAGVLTWSADNNAGADNLGNHNATTRIQPVAGNNTTSGLYWPTDPGGGSGDEAWLRYYVRSGEATTLELGTNNDADDHINLSPGAGNVGIGTNTPAHKLDVPGGNIRASGQSAMMGTHPSYSGYSAWWRNGVDYSMLTDANNTFINAPAAAGNIYLRTANADKVFIRGSDGNVGIGNTGPAYKLDVTGAIRSQDYGAAGSVNIMVGDDTYFTDIDVGSMVGLYSTSNGAFGGLRFGNVSTAYLYSNGTGNIGLNTLTPASKFTVNAGSIRIIGSTNTNAETSGMLIYDNTAGMGAGTAKKVERRTQVQVATDLTDYIIYEDYAMRLAVRRNGGVYTLRMSPKAGFTGYWDMAFDAGGDRMNLATAGTWYNVTDGGLTLDWGVSYSGGIEYILNREATFGAPTYRVWPHLHDTYNSGRRVTVIVEAWYP